MGSVYTNCSWCSKEFTHKRRTAQYCSESCRKKNSRYKDSEKRESMMLADRAKVINGIGKWKSQVKRLEPVKADNQEIELCLRIKVVLTVQHQ